MYEATQLLSSSLNPTQGDIRLVFVGMFKKLNQYQRRGHYTQKEIVLAIYNKLKKYWDDHLNYTFTISLVLDLHY